MKRTLLDLHHLSASAQEAALLPIEDRIRYIRAERWIAYARAQSALSRLEELLSWPKKQRMPNLLIVGPTNNGKSKIVEKFKRDQTPKMSADGIHESIPVVIVQVPSEPASGRFYALLFVAA